MTKDEKSHTRIKMVELKRPRSMVKCNTKFNIKEGFQLVLGAI